jgi:hypothetical protein
MSKTLQTCIGAAVLIVALSVAWLCYCASWSVLEWGHAGHAATENIAKLGAAADGINATTARLNGPHGTLTMLDDDIGAAKSLIVHADLVARHEQQQLGKLDSQEDTLFADLHGMAAAGTGAALQATVDLQTANDTILAGKAGVQSFTLAGQDLDETVKGLQPTVRDLAGMMENTRQITADTRAVADDVSTRFLTPKPKHWWNWIAPVWEVAWRAAMLAK